MGVKGLLSYITDEDDVLQTVELSQLVTKICYETKMTPKLLCDFMNLVPHFLNPPVMKLTSCGDYPWYAQVTGADFHLIAERACNFVAALKHLGVEPVFFIDGARGTDESFEGKAHVLKYREAQKLQKYFRLQQICERTVDKNIGVYLPCNAIQQIKKSIKKAGAEIVYCTGEADPEIIHYAQSHDEVCGILSNDSDFAITNGCVMFPIETFDVNNSLGLLKDVLVDDKPGEIVCQVIYPSMLADSLGIRENQLPDLAVLCGTDYTHHLNQQLSVLTRLGVKGGGVESIAEWLKDKEMPLLHYQPMRELCTDHPELRVAIEQSYNNYTLDVPKNIDSPPTAVTFASPLYHIIEKEACCGENNMLLTVAKKGILWRTMIIENLTLGQPCLSSLLLPLRRVMYALLGMQEVREYGRSQMEAYDEVVVPVCTKPGDIELGIQCFHSLRELEQSGQLVGMFRLMNQSLDAQNIRNVKKVVDEVVCSSHELPDLPGCRLVQSAMLCCCLKFIACLNKVSQPPLGLTDSELDAILLTCLTCATDGQIMPHIVNVMPSMRTITVSEWFALILMHCYRVASLVGVVSCPEPKQMFYQMAFVPHHLSLESHINITTEQQLEIDYVQNAMKTALTFPSVETLRTSIFNSDELQPLSLLVTLFSAALDEVMENADKLLPCVMAMDDKDLVKEKSCSEPKGIPETDSESGASQSESEVNDPSPSNEPRHSNLPPSESKYQDAQFQSLKEAVDRAVASHSLQSSISPAKAKLKSLSRMNLSARQSALKDYIWEKEGLPVTEHRQEILNLISKHQVVCIEGETGCGKSSQVPQFILEACEQCRILASQPNLLAARKLAQRVSEEKGEPLGATVGYCDELGDIPQQTVLTFGTTGYILKALLKSQTECSYTHIILDEIHERSTEIDYALFITRKLAVAFPDLKIILVSATLQGNLFIEYFRKELGHDKVADPHFVGIKRFPVKVVFIDQLDQLVSTREDKEQRAAMTQLQLLARKLENNATQLLPYAPEVTPFTAEVCMNLIISQLSPGDAVLIFLSGFGDINEFCNNLHRKLKKLGMRHRYRLFIFHSQVQNEDQDKAFQEPSEGTANIVVSNRGSESSLTIPYLRLVINFGINKEMMYNSAKRISELSRQWCSHASCIQREGRVGRVSEGTAVHLFTKEFYETLPDFGPPEIIRVPLAKTFLRAKEIGPQLGIPLPSRLLSMVIEPPSFVQFSTALHDLAEYGAIAHNPHHKISEEADVTLLGKFSLSLPLDLNLCRLVLLGILFGCPLDGIVIAAATAMYQDVFLKPMKVVMNELHQFCHSLTTSTFSRMKYDAGCYSNPIMILNMFIDWLQYKSRHSHTSRRDLAVKFGSNNAVKPARLLHFEEFVGDIARCVANCIPRDTTLYSELQTLSHISTEMKGFPVLCDTFMYGEQSSPLQPAKYIPPHLRNLKSQKRDRVPLHFCNNYVMLKALIAAAAPDDILCGERACESSHPYTRTFAQECIKVIKNEGFSLNHTLCMDLSDLDEVDIWVEDIQRTDEAALEKLFRSLPRGFRLSVETKVVEDVAVLHFQPHTHDPFFALTKIAKSFAIKNWDSSTADISQISPKADFFWRFGEQNTLWDIDQVDAVFPAPSHPCALMWYRFDEVKSNVNTVLLNFRNPTGFVCQYDKPSQPYFAVATGAFVSSGGSILVPTLTILPNMPTSLMMVLTFQLPTSAIEFLINKKNKTVKAIKMNSVEIPCTDIQNCMSSNEIVAINQVRNAVSNVMALSLNRGCIPLYDTAITKIPKLLHDLLSFHKIPQPMAANSQAPSMNEALEGLVWELVTPGKNTEEQSASAFYYYPEFKCSLIGAKPYAVKEVCHDQELPLSPFPIEYTQSVSATLLAESKRILEQGREDELDDLSSVPESLKEMSVISSDEENTENRFAENIDWKRVASVNVSAAGISEDKEWAAGTTEANMECKTTLNSKKMKQKHEQLEVTTDAKSEKKTMHNKVGSEPDSRQVIAEQCLVKLEQEVIRHLQRNNKMEFLSELKVQRRIKHLCSSIGINLDVNFFRKWPELFKVQEVEEGEEGSDAAVTGKEYLIILDPSKWEDVVEDEGPVLPMSAQLLQVTMKSQLAAKEKDIVQRQNAEDISGEEEKVQSDKEADLDNEKAVLSEKKRVQREQEAFLEVIEKEKLKQEEDVEEWVEREQEPSPAEKENEKLKREIERVEREQEVSLKLKQKVQECEETLSEEKLERGKEATLLEKEKIQREKEEVVSKGSIEKEIKASPREVQEREAALIEKGVKREKVAALKEKENEKLKQEEEADFNEERVEREQEVSLKLKQKVQQCEEALSEEKLERGKEATLLEKEKIQREKEEVVSKGSIKKKIKASPREVQEREAALIEKMVKREKVAALKEKENDKLKHEEEADFNEERVEREQEVSLKLKQKVQECEETLSEEKLERGKEATLLEKEKIQREKEEVVSKGSIEKEIKASPREVQEREAALIEKGVKREKVAALKEKENEKLKQEEEADFNEERVEREQEVSLKLKQKVQQCEEALSEEKLERGKEATLLEKEKIQREKEEVVSKGSIKKKIKASPREVQEREAALIEKMVKREKVAALKEKENDKLKHEEEADFNEERVEREQEVSLKLKQKVQQCEEALSEEKLERGKEANVMEKEKVQSKTEVLSKGSLEREKKASPREVQEREAALIEKRVKREKGAALKEKGNREAALCEKVRVEREKDVALKEKGSMQKEAEVALHEKERVETDKVVPLKKHENVGREEEAALREKDERKEKKKKRKRKKKKENEREKKEAALAATTSEQEPPTQSATAGLVPEGSQLFSLSQFLLDNAGGKHSVSKPLPALETEGENSLTTATDNPKISEGNSTESKIETVNRCQAGVELLEVSHTNETLKETAVSGSHSTKQKVTSEIAPKKIPAQPGTGEHMAQFLVDFINECGGQTKLATLRREAFRQYQAKYVQCTYMYLGKGFLKKYDFFEIFEDGSGVCHVRVVGAKRRPLLSTELEKTEHKTKKMTKSLSPKSGHGTEEHERRHGSCDTGLLEGEFDGSPEHIVQYLYNYLSTNFFPYGCPVSSLDELYQKEYVPKCINPKVEMIDENFLKEFPNHFTLQGRHMFVKLKEGVDHSDTSQLSGSPYTPQHVKHYFRKYLGREGVVCTQQLQKLFDECYMKEFKMPQKPLIWFIRDDFFKQSCHLFVTFTDFVVFRK